uniref:EXPERA domain-containing protein n=1 Tax=Aegilops tauschii subsp. strangulata TaxID=200361 RepID=A0A453M223_AEGTS
AEAMGVVSAVADAVVVLFSLTIAVGVPLIDAQAVLSHDAYPAQLRDLKRWYAAEFDDYLMAQPPAFFRGLLCLELAFLWPLSVATVYGVLARRRWAATTSLMVGVTTLTSLVTLVCRPLPAHDLLRACWSEIKCAACPSDLQNQRSTPQ